MKRIVKIIFDDQTSSEPARIKPLEILESDNSNEKYLKKFNYRNQFRSFEDEILENLHQPWVEKYAEDNFDLVPEDDVKEKKIDDFSDLEIMQEFGYRNLGVSFEKASIVSQDFITRFCKIMEKENQILLDNVLTEFENKLNI